MCRIAAERGHLPMLLQAQVHLGWYAFLCGFVATDPTHRRQLYYSSLPSQRRGDRWAIKVIIKQCRFSAKLFFFLFCEVIDVFCRRVRQHQIKFAKPNSFLISFRIESSTSSPSSNQRLHTFGTPVMLFAGI